MEWIHHLVNVLGMLLRQPTRHHKHSYAETWRLKRVFILTAFAGFFFTAMYNVVIISVLTAGQDVQRIDTLTDLTHKFKDKLIYVTKGSTAHDFLKSSSYFKRLEKRIEFLPAYQTMDMLENTYRNLHLGTHVLITFHWVVNVNYQVRFSDQFVCTYPKENLRWSQVPVLTLFGSMMYKKNFKYQELFDQTILWLQAYGVFLDLDTPIPAIRANENKDSIFIPTKTEVKCPQSSTTATSRSSERSSCSSNHRSRVVPLAQFHLETLWLAFGIGLAISFVTFITEIACFRLHQGDENL